MNEPSILTAGEAASVQVWRGRDGVSPDVVRAFRELLPYCFAEGERWQYLQDDLPVVRYTTADRSDRASIDQRLDLAWERAAGTRSRPARVLFDQPMAVAAVAGPADVRPVGPGLVVLGPTLARLASAVDRYAQELARSLGASEYTVPHLTSWETIDRAGYARTFPQNLTACSVVGPDLVALDRFAAASGVDERAGDLRAAAVTAAPTVCLNIFAAHADQSVAEPLRITARQACTRHEMIAEGPTRLWSFTMREIVHIGDPDGCRDFCRDVVEALIDWLRSLGLPALVCSASDPFFTSDRDALSSYQARLDLKQEVRGRMAGDGREVAISSINLHQEHFGESFGITTPAGDSSSSACVGFGLERWAQWLHGHVGDDARQWPPPLRRLAEG